MATKDTVQLSQRHEEAFDRLKERIANLKEFEGKQVTNLDFRPSNPDLNKIIMDFNGEISDTGMELHSFQAASPKWCNCPTLGKIVPCGSCPNCNC